MTDNTTNNEEKPASTNSDIKPNSVQVLESESESSIKQSQPTRKKWLFTSGAFLLLVIVATIITLALKNSSSSNIQQSGNVTHTVTTSTNSNNNSTQKPNIPQSINPINPAAIPLGTGKVSTTPKVGYVDFCNNKNTSVAPEPSNLTWINTANNTWNSETKPAVQGSVSWASTAYYTNTLAGNVRKITTNDLPIGHDTGIYPISITDPAYHWDHNPNHITAQPTTWNLPANPTAATNPSCTSDGPIGILSDGVFLFNALDAANRDAGATEIVDQWQGHPQSQGMYHHHMVPTYMLKAHTAKSSSTLVGYALDGYGIYIERDANGNLLTNANLDACHGRTSWVLWNGKMTYMYHYDVTLEYPYTVGCFHGNPINIRSPGSGNTQVKPPKRPAA